MDPNEPKNLAQQAGVNSGTPSQSQGGSQLTGSFPTSSTVSGPLTDNSTPPDETPASPLGYQTSVQTSIPTTAQVEEKEESTDQEDLVSLEKTASDEMFAGDKKPTGGGGGATGTL